MSSNITSLNVNKIKEYIDKKVDQRIHNVINNQLITQTEKVSLYFNDLDGTAETIKGNTSGFTNVFTEDVSPDLDNEINSSEWSAVHNSTLHASSDYGVLIYNGPNCNTQVETTFLADSNTNTFNINTQLFLNGSQVNEAVSGGRGYQIQCQVNFYPTNGVGSGAIGRPVVLNGKVQSINIINRGTKYTQVPRIEITGSGIDCLATCTINSAGGVDVVTLSNVSPCPDGISGIFPTAQNVPNGCIRTYSFKLVRGDRLELRAKVSDSSDVANSEIFQAKLKVTKQLLKTT